MTTRELFNNTQQSLQSLYPENEAKTIVEWLFCDVLKLKNRIALYENFDIIIPEQTQTKIQRKLKRLQQFEPIQYVLHKAWFMNLELHVSSDVLIPRPETEELCHTLLNEVKLANANLLDLATGSGCLAIAIKKTKPNWEVTATDISPSALKLSNCNASRHKVNINFVLDDMLHSSLIHTKKQFDIIVSNPPYIPISEKKIMRPNVTNYEPSIALYVPDQDPLLFYRAIAQIAEECLHPNGSIYMEVHENYANKKKAFFESKNWNTKIYFDMNDKPRFIKAQKNG
jgi:release factor glutamine methyltransferase